MMTTDMTTCCESPSKETSQDSNTSSASPPKKRQHVEDEALAMKAHARKEFIETYGEEYYTDLEDFDEDDFEMWEQQVSYDCPCKSDLYAELVVKYLNDTQAKVYVLRGIRSMYINTSKKITHMNIFAIEEGLPEVYLFYAELDNSDEPAQVVSCSIVRTFEQYPSWEISKDLIIHAESVSCSDCSQAFADVMMFADDLDCE